MCDYIIQMRVRTCIQSKAACVITVGYVLSNADSRQPFRVSFGPGKPSDSIAGGC